MHGCAASADVGGNNSPKQFVGVCLEGDVGNNPPPMDYLSTGSLQTTDVRRRSTTLALWFNGTGEAHHIDGMARATLAHVWFETIHPFADGDGRIGRAISDKALAQDMKRSPRLFRVSQQMWLDRKG